MTTEAGVNRAHQLSEEIADLICDIKDRETEMRTEIGLKPLEIGGLIGTRLGAPVLEWLRSSIAPFTLGKPEDPFGQMRAHIDKLFTERGVKGAESDTPAVPDVLVWLRGVLQPLAGVLSKTPEGLLRLGSAGQMGKDAFLVDQAFAYEDVLSIATKNAITSEPKSGLISTAH